MNKDIKLKPRKMWANYYPDKDVTLHRLKCKAHLFSAEHTVATAVPVAVIPINDVDELVARASCAFNNDPFDRDAARDDAMRDALTAIGVLPKQRKGRK